MPVRGIRGAVQVPDNSSHSLAREVPVLIQGMLEINQLSYDCLISILFTSTPDLNADFPAAAARSLPLGDVPLICAQEIEVPHGMPRVVRVLMHVETDIPRKAIEHAYLGATKDLRRDLAQ